MPPGQHAGHSGAHRACSLAHCSTHRLQGGPGQGRGHPCAASPTRLQPVLLPACVTDVSLRELRVRLACSSLCPVLHRLLVHGGGYFMVVEEFIINKQFIDSFTNDSSRVGCTAHHRRSDSPQR